MPLLVGNAVSIAGVSLLSLISDRAGSPAKQSTLQLCLYCSTASNKPGQLAN